MRDFHARGSARPRAVHGGGAKTATKGYDLETPMGRALAWSRSLRALGIANGNQELAVEIAKGWLESAATAGHQRAREWLMQHYKNG